MDINTLRSLSTVLVFIVFIGICWWAFAPSRRERFKDAANLPFADEQSKAEHNEEQSASEDKTRSES